MFLEVFVRTVIKESQSSSPGGGVVDDFRHKALVVTEIEFVADSYFSGRIDDHIPQMLFPVELAQEEDHDVCSGLFLLSVQPGRDDLGVIEHEGVALPEIFYDVLENFVLNLSRVLVDDHQATFVAPSGRFGCKSFLWEKKLELRKFHIVSVT